jgi:hypothetical protein
VYAITKTLSTDLRIGLGPSPGRVRRHPDAGRAVKLLTGLTAWEQSGNMQARFTIELRLITPTAQIDS